MSEPLNRKVINELNIALLKNLGIDASDVTEATLHIVACQPPQLSISYSTKWLRDHVGEVVSDPTHFRLVPEGFKLVSSDPQ
jgi:hypothetical protein